MTTPTTQASATPEREDEAFKREYGPSDYENSPLNPKRVAFGKGFRAALTSTREATAEPAAVSVGVVEALERLTRWAQAAHGDKTTYSGDHPIAWAMQALAAQDTQKAEAWKSAHDDARDAILNGRGPLEAVLDVYQTNAVLDAFDDAFSPLYATPQKAEATQAEPMSDETIERMVLNRPDMAQAIHFDIIPMGAFVDLGRAILAEAGIKEKP